VGQLVAAGERRSGVVVPQWSGSGTIISADGLILTNCHVAFPRAMWDDPEFDYDLLIVALTIRSDEAPQPTYLAEVMQYDPDLDLAVIRVSQMLDGSPVNREELSLPALALGDSDAIELGDRLYIFGYPGIGGDTITFTSGDVSGFSREEGVEGRAWIKTDATVAGGNSGGTAVNEQGELVGVPTQGGAGSAKEIVDCRYVADTNGDGVIDENDTCVPMGGFINALRPVNLARPLIEAARRGLVQPRVPSPGPGREEPAEEPAVSRLIFAPAINQADQPVTVVDAFPTGTRELYLFFDYRGFRDGTPWQPILARDGEVLTDTWPLSPWNGGSQGTWWVGLSDAALPDGSYEFSIVYGGEPLASAAVKVGGPPAEGPTFSNVTFAVGQEEGYLLPAGSQEIRASFEYAGLSPDVPWTYRFYREGSELERGDGEPLPQGSGKGTIVLRRSPAFSAGNYRLELYLKDRPLALGGRLAATADFTLTGGPKGPAFSPITFAEGVDRKGNPVRPGTAFESGLKELYAFFDYEGMRDGWQLTTRWSLDGEVILGRERAWEGGESGKNFWVNIHTKSGALPEGQYKLELLVEGELVQSGTCTVGGKGPRPTPIPQPPQNGVEIYGRITDAETGRGIEGAYFVVLQPGIRVAEFDWRASQIYTVARTDRAGYYQLPLPLVRGESYGVIVAASGYQTIAEDDQYVGEDTQSPLEVNVELSKVR